MSLEGKRACDLETLEDWNNFVDVHHHWENRPDVIKFLSWRWTQLERECPFFLFHLPQHSNYWNALLDLEREEYQRPSGEEADPSSSKRGGGSKIPNLRKRQKPHDSDERENAEDTTSDSDSAEVLLKGSDNVPSLVYQYADDGKKLTCQHLLEGSEKRCGATFGKLAGLKRHVRSQHRQDRPTCDSCHRKFQSNWSLKKHVCRNQRAPIDIVMAANDEPIEESVPVSTEADFSVETLWCTMGVTRFRFTPHAEEIDYDLALRNVIWRVKNSLAIAASQYGSVKYQLKSMMHFQQAKDPEDKGRHYFTPSTKLLMNGRGVEEQLLDVGEEISESIAAYINKGSGWTVEQVAFFDLDVMPYRPLHGSSFIQLPRALSIKKAIINVQNYDDKCFLWALLAALHPATKDAQRVSHYLAYEGTLNFAAVPFPVTLENVWKVEQINNLRINVFGFNSEGLHPLHITDRRDQPDAVINLLMLKLGDNVHYCWIKYLDRLLSTQKGHRNHHFFCPFCLFGFVSDERRRQHVHYCQTGTQRVQMPDPGTILKFQKVKNQLVLPLVVYADFECFLQPVAACGPDPAASSTTKTHIHVPNSFAACCVEKCGCSMDGSFTNGRRYRGEDPVDHFLQYCLDVGEAHQSRLDNVQQIRMEKWEWKLFSTTDVCHICKEAIRITDNNWNKVRDHCHICGKFRGPAHSRCNIEFRKQRDVPVVLHNLRRYDGHLIMEKIGVIARQRGMDIECVPRGFEDYLAFSLVSKHELPNKKKVSWKLRFIDSFQFLSSSLEKLAENLLGINYSGESKFKCLQFTITNPTRRRLLLRKGVYPYEYMDNSRRFLEKELPSIDKFHSALKGCGITASDYQHAQVVWSEFGFSDLGEYHDLYLNTDVVLLTDVFENFRSSCLSHYGLDPTHYITLPSFAWDACLKYTSVKLDLLSDPDMYMFFEDAIRGGVSTISNRFSQANSPTLPDYDDNDNNKFIMYFDANNLYGWSMSQPMPVSDFQWLSRDEIDSLPSLENIGDDDEFGYVLEVDLEYPVNLHDEHNDYPLAPESLLITDNMLSPYSSRLKSELQIMSGKVKKLTPNLYGKQRYVVHYRNLKYYLALGMRLTRIRRVLTFMQAPWMKSYIEFNTEQRKLATTSFEKDFFKLLNNAVFGKSMENVRKYRNIKLVSNQKALDKLVADPRFEELQIFTEELIAVSLAQDTVQLNKPIYVGFSVLDLSKLLMYEFHYGYVKRRFGHRVKLLFTDTDSLCYQFDSTDIYKEIAEDATLFDFSDYPKAHPLFSERNKKVIGKMKDEMNGVEIEEFVGLRAKMYSVLYGGIEKKTAKGISKTVVKSILRHSDYVDALFGERPQRHSMVRFQSKAHTIFTITQRKISLCCFDDKRWITANGVDTLAHGHWRIDGGAVNDEDQMTQISGSTVIQVRRTMKSRSTVTLMDVANEVANQMLTATVQKADGADGRFNVAYQQALKKLGIHMEMPVWRDVVRVCLSSVLVGNHQDEELVTLVKDKVRWELEFNETCNGCQPGQHGIFHTCNQTLASRLGQCDLDFAYHQATDSLMESRRDAVLKEVKKRLVLDNM